MVCCFTNWPQQSWQISPTMRAPMAPGNGAFSNPARVCPHRTHFTSATIKRHGSWSGPSVLDLCEANELKQADVQPSDVELVPLGLELRGLRIGVVIVVQLLAAEPDRDRRNIPALVLHLEG